MKEYLRIDKHLCENLPEHLPRNPPEHLCEHLPEHPLTARPAVRCAWQKRWGASATAAAAGNFLISKLIT